MATIRKRSRKRDAILACVRATTCHPSAEWVYQRLKPTIPDLSLGTVYRNLSMFKDEGLVISVGTVGGLERFDGNTKPHTHFVCTRCSAVLDLMDINLEDEFLAKRPQTRRAAPSQTTVSASTVCAPIVCRRKHPLNKFKSTTITIRKNKKWRILS